MKKLYRFPEQRKIAGVCAGLGEYFDIDPLLFRLGFLVSVLLGGLGVLAYVIMWVMVPPSAGGSVHHSNAPRLSTTNVKLGGVCGGLGEYFHIDPLLFRIGMVVLACVWGMGIVIYAVLWLLMPRGPAMHTPGDLAV